LIPLRAVELGLDRAELAGDNADLGDPPIVVAGVGVDAAALDGRSGRAEMSSA
jgi:hypothetical protein